MANQRFLNAVSCLFVVVLLMVLSSTIVVVLAVVFDFSRLAPLKSQQI